MSEVSDPRRSNLGFAWPEILAYPRAEFKIPDINAFRPGISNGMDRYSSWTEVKPTAVRVAAPNDRGR